MIGGRLLKIFYWVFSIREGHRGTLEIAIAVLRHNYILVCILLNACL